MDFGKLLGTLIVAFIGAGLGIRFRVPAGGMIGSLVAVAIYNYFSQMGYMPANLKIIGQIIIGGTIGMNFTKSSLAEMKQVFSCRNFSGYFVDGRSDCRLHPA